MKKATEIRYNKDKLRAVTVFEVSTGIFDLRFNSGGKPGGDDWPNWMLRFSPREYYAGMTQEAFSRGLSREAARKKVVEWKKRCHRDGLTEVKTWYD